MEDPKLTELEQTEKRAFAAVVFIAKITTWIALLLLGLTVEAALVIKVYKAEFGESHQVPRDKSGLLGSPGLEIPCSPRRSLSHLWSRSIS